MRLLHKDLEKDGPGSITLYPEEDEDMVTTPPLLSLAAAASNPTCTRSGIPTI